LTDSNTNDWLTVFRSTTTNRETLAAWTTDIAGVSTVSDWGTYYLNGTPLYVGQSQTRAAGNGKWSDHSWDGGSTWVNGSQATFGNSGQTITVDGSPTISALQFNVDGVTLNGGTLNFTSGGGAIHTETGTATINSVIAGGGDPAVFQIRKSGTGTLTLGAANTITSEIIIGQGAVQLGNTDAVRNNTVTANVANGLKFSSGIGTFTLGSLAGSGNIALADTGGTAVALQVGNKNVDSSYSGILSGSGSLKKIGSGLLTLSGQNTYTGGTTISAGSLSLKFPTFGTSAPAAGSIKIESDGVLVANGAYTSVRTWINSGKINAGSEGVLATTANIASGSSSINMSNYAGLSIGSTGDYTLSRAVTPANNTYRFGGGGGNLNVSIVLGNNGSTPRSLVSRGNVTLTNSNTYSGTTTVDSGTLTLSSTGSINSTSGIMLNSGALRQNLSTVISITNGGTVGGTGTYAGDLDLGNGHLSPGDKPVAIGALRVTGNLSMSAESVLDYDWGSTAGSCDRLAFTESGGNLTLDGTINIISSGDIVRGSYAIVSGASSITDRGLDFGVVPAGHDWAYSIANDNGVYSVIVTAAPEPGTLALLATGLLGILAYAWRKRR
jgi:autotransporter-associated beta strand protein